MALRVFRVQALIHAIHSENPISCEVKSGCSSGLETAPLATRAFGPQPSGAVGPNRLPFPFFTAPRGFGTLGPANGRARSQRSVISRASGGMWLARTDFIAREGAWKISAS